MRPTAVVPQSRRRHQHRRERAHPAGRHRLGRRRSTSCRRRCPTSARSRSSSAGSAPTCAPAHAQIRPGVDAADKVTAPAHLERGRPVARRRASRQPARGPRRLRRHAVGCQPSSPPSRTCKARGLAVTLTPFIFMDVPAGNALPDPYTGGAAQPAYPWRGRITVSPAAGQPGSPDKTRRRRHPDRAPSSAPPRRPTSPSSARASSIPAPPSGRYRRFILHYAHLRRWPPAASMPS